VDKSESTIRSQPLRGERLARRPSHDQPGPVELGVAQFAELFRGTPAQHVTGQYLKVNRSTWRVRQASAVR
jgi:hypothetical protein